MTHRRAPLGAAALPLVFIALAGCATPGPSPSSPSESASAPGATDGGTAPATLTGTSWTVVSIAGSNTLPDAPPTMAFDAGGRIGGTGGCNQYSGPYTIDGDAISIGDLASTLMLCEGDRGAQETAFLNALRGAQTWRVTEEGDLELGGASTIVARPADASGSPSPAASGGLQGAWDLVELGQTADLAHFVPTIEFAADGGVSGFASCNTFQGTYTTDGATLTLGHLATTEIGCPRPASAIEAAYLGALRGVSSWAIEPDGRLLLDGAVPLRYTRH